jgi:hypothetical protein
MNRAWEKIKENKKKLSVTSLGQCEWKEAKMQWFQVPNQSNII